MSLSPIALGKVTQLLVKLPTSAVLLIIDLLSEALRSGEDPEHYLRRRLTADTAHLGSQETARKLLEKS